MKQKYSAASLCSITTEVLKVLNATEELIGEAGGESYTPSDSVSASPISVCSDTRRMDQKLTKMEENVSNDPPAVSPITALRRIGSGTSHSSSMPRCT